MAGIIYYLYSIGRHIGRHEAHSSKSFLVLIHYFAYDLDKALKTCPDTEQIYTGELYELV